MTADSTILIAVKSDGSGARVIKRDLDDIANKSDKTTKKVDLLKRAFVGLGAVLSVRAFSRFADSITELDTKLNNVSKNSAAATKSFNELFIVAQKNGDGVAGLVDVYSKLSAVLPDNVKAGNDLIKTTELLSRGLAATGANAQTAQGVLLQLSQGLAGNFESSAQELNSLIEGAPVLAKVIAEQLGGKAATDLKRFAEEGELTADIFLKALAASEDAIKSFEIPQTISRSITRISNEFVRLGKESEILRGLSGFISTALDGVAASLDTILKIAGVLVASTIPLLITQFARLLPVAIAATTTAFTALTVAVSANPIGAIAVGIAAVISALFLFRKEIFESFKDVQVFGINVTDVFFGIKNTAIAVFSTMGDIILTPFDISYNLIKKRFVELKVLANDAIALSNRTFGSQFKFLNLDQSDLLLFQKSDSQIINERLSARSNSIIGNYDDAINNTKQDITDFAKATDDVGLSDTGNGTAVATPPIVEAIEKAGKKTKDTVKDLTLAFDDLVGSIIDSFESGFDGGQGVIDSFVNGAKNSFQNLFKDIAQTFARPIVGKIIAGVTGGAAGAAASGGLLSGAGGGFDIGQTISSISSLLNSGGPITLGGLVPGGIGQSLGFAQALPSGVFGPAAPGSIFGSTTLGGALGGGAVGGLAAQLLGLGSGNALVDTGTGLAGTAIGAIFGGPIGAGIGSFLGTALGGLFGGSKPSDKAQAAFFNFDTLESAQTGQSGDKFSQQNRDFSDAVIKEAVNLSELLKMAGAEISGNIGVVAGNRDGLRLEIINPAGQTSFRNFGTDTDALIKAVAQGVVDGITSAPEDLMNVLNNVSGFDTAQVAEALGILELVRSFEKAGEAARPLGDALDALDDQFKELADKALGLGLPVDKLTESYQKQKDAIIRDTLAPLQQWLDAQALSGSSSFSPTDRLSLARSRFDETLSQINMGDFSNIGDITSQASSVLSAGRDVFASGEGFASLERFVRESVAGVGESLGAPSGSLESGLSEMAISNAEQVSLSQQMLVELQALREENRKLRKSMERVGNAVVSTS